ncbi:MAG: efflux RND transporter permease subunit [Thiohalomonadales bacterium]
MSKPLGLSGSIAKIFLTSELTPLIALLGIFLGVFAVLLTPKEEEPQINVTFANIFIAFPGASALEVEQLISTPAEQVLSEIEGIKHTYSVSHSGMSIITVQFAVGEDRTQAIVRLYNKIFSNQDWLPSGIGVAKPIIKPMGIDDVPIVSLTLWSDDVNTGTLDLQSVAHSLEVDLKRIEGTRDIYTIGAVDRVVRVLPDSVKMAGYGVTLIELRRSLQATNSAINDARLVAGNKEIIVQAGRFMHHVQDVEDLIIKVVNDRPIYLKDVAQILAGAAQSERYVSYGSGPGAKRSTQFRGAMPAVTIAIAKKPGTNAVDIADNIISRLAQLEGVLIPQGVNVSVTRNYGATANDKANKLIGKLVFATSFVVLLVLFTLGYREAIIVGAAVVITLAITLFASWLYGFSINRVSLFALIFSIGILVDDAIVVVENIHRHRQLGGKSLFEAIPIAVDEVGGPTILATFAVIAALLPMAFVSGLMGPYMSPIPINASMGMLISLAIAFIVTPWMALKLLKNQTVTHADEGQVDKLYEFFKKTMSRFLNKQAGRVFRWLLFGGIILLILMSISLPIFKLVVLKMLPFDNKSELQVVVDMPEGSSVERTSRVLNALAAHIATIPEVDNYQLYAGTAAPINFNGLVRQYYLRDQAHQGDIQINLVSKGERERKSHEIATALRAPLQAIAKPLQANVKIVEVPPGPPVMAPIVAEIYGLDYAGQKRMAKLVSEKFAQAADIVDIDDSVEAAAERLLLSVDVHKAALLGVSQQQVVEAIRIALQGEDASYLRSEDTKFPIPIRIELSAADKANIEQLLLIKVRSTSGKLVSLSDVVQLKQSQREQVIYHKDLLPMTFVTADLAGELDSPLYGMFDIMSLLTHSDNKALAALDQSLISTPDDIVQYTLKWDGEWQITYETFRDMGIAYAVGILLIYLLVVAQFKSYFIPLIILSPIPLTIIGVMPGHALLGIQYTATSMIGMIALAGIIVRNSILLIDFIKEQIDDGVALQEAVIRAGAVRAKPIILTGLAAMLGALFIIDDPIFSGLAVSLIFGILVSTALTLFVIPVMYYAFNYKKVV